MKTRTRLLSVFLALALLLSLLPATALASSSEAPLLQAVTTGTNNGAVLTGGGALWYWSEKDAAPKKVISSGVTAIAAGMTDYILAAKDDGSLWSWGANSQGQLGDGTTSSHSTPEQVEGLDGGVVSVAASQTVSAALTETGGVWIWGQTGSYLGGSGNSGNQRKPVQVAGLSEITAIAVSNVHALALAADGSLWAWGENARGQFGNGLSGFATNKATPSQVVAPGQLGSEIRSVGAASFTSANSAYSYAVTADGALWHWGGSSTAKITVPQRVGSLKGISVVKAVRVQDGYLVLDEGGNLWSVGAPEDASGVSFSEPILVAEGVADFSAAHYTGYTLLILKEDGTVLRRVGVDGEFSTIEGGWIEEYVPPVDPNPDPVQPPPERRITGMYQGNYHVLALWSDGSLWSWGSNEGGQLGLPGQQMDSLTPVKIMDNVVSAAAGSWYSLAVTSDGTLWGFGSNTYGSLGDGTTESSMLPKRIMDGVAKVYADDEYTIILKQDGTLWECGRRSYTNTATGGRDVIPEPRQIHSFPAVVDVLVTGSGYLALDTMGCLHSWGLSSSDRLALGAGVSYTLSPYLMLGNSLHPYVISASLGSAHAMAVMEDGTVYGWGSNSSGQLGDSANTGSGVTFPDPVNISERSPALSQITAVSCTSSGNSMLLREDGQLWLVGTFHWNGRSYSNSRLAILSNVQSMKQSTTGDNFVILRDGTLLSWGDYGSGYLTSSETPEEILTDVYDVFILEKSGFSPRAFAVKNDGTVWAWGSNNLGMLGDGTETNRTEPVQVIFDEDPQPEPSDPVEVPVVRVAAGYAHSLAIRSDGSVWAWGDNRNGQLGNGETSATGVPTPQQVPGLEDVAAVAAGRSHSAAIQQGGVLYTWGDNSSGQLGNNSSVVSESLTPLRIMDGVTAVDAAGNYTLALKADGTLWGWGYPGSMGFGNGETSSRRPIQIMSDVKDFSAGQNAVAVVKTDGSLWVWGARTAIGVDGDDIFDWVNDPVEERATMVAYSGVESVSVGNDCVLYVTTDGTLYARGTDHYGETGTGKQQQMKTPVYVTTGVESVQAGIYTSTLIKTDGSLWVCGMLDLNAPISGLQMTPKKWMDGPVSDANLSFGTTMDELYGHGLLIQGDMLYTWGGNYYGQLGNGGTGYVRSPQAVMYIPYRSDLPISLEELTLHDNHGSYFVTAALANGSSYDRQVGLWAALYDSRGRMADLRQLCSTTVAANTEFTPVELEMDYAPRVDPVGGGYELKVFTLAQENLTPLAEPQTPEYAEVPQLTGISVSKSAYNVYLNAYGDYVRVTGHYTAGKPDTQIDAADCQFTSSNPDVAYVEADSGIIRFGLEGSAVITVSYSEGGRTATAQIYVTVTIPVYSAHPAVPDYGVLSHNEPFLVQDYGYVYDLPTEFSYLEDYYRLLERMGYSYQPSISDPANGKVYYMTSTVGVQITMLDGDLYIIIVYNPYI